MKEQQQNIRSALHASPSYKISLGSASVSRRPKIISGPDQRRRCTRDGDGEI